MKGIVACLLLVPLVGGCAVSKDGVGFASRPHLVKNGVLIVGTTGPLRTLNDTERAAFYRDYVAAAQASHPGPAPGEPPVLTETQFNEKIAGWASIQTFSVP